MVTSVLQGIQIVVDATGSVSSRASAEMEIVTGSEYFDLYFNTFEIDGLNSSGNIGAARDIRVNGVHLPNDFGSSPTVAMVDLAYTGGGSSTVVFTRSDNADGTQTFSFFLVEGDAIPTGSISSVRSWFNSITGASLPEGDLAPGRAVTAPTFESFVSVTYDDRIDVVEDQQGRYRLGIGNDTFIGSDMAEEFGDFAYSFDYEFMARDGSGIRTSTFEGDEVVYGGDGDDSIDGRGGTDFLSGEAGDDTLEAGEYDSDPFGFQENVLFGGTGNDVLVGAAVAAATVYSGSLFGDAGNDLLEGGNGQEDLDGGLGNDTVNGGDGDDFMGGSDGRDRMSGGRGNDLVHGGTGNDNLFGDAGSDEIQGATGNDTLTGGAGRDLLIGGTGADRFVFASGSGKDTVLDLNIVEGDRLQISSSLLVVGVDTAQEIVDTYGETDIAGFRLVFDSGDTIRLVGIVDPAGLAAGILIV